MLERKKKRKRKRKTDILNSTSTTFLDQQVALTMEATLRKSEWKDERSLDSLETFEVTT